MMECVCVVVLVMTVSVRVMLYLSGTGEPDHLTSMDVSMTMASMVMLGGVPIDEILKSSSLHRHGCSPALHLTPASSPWLQLISSCLLLGQSTSRVSLPRHCTLSKRIGPLPCPKGAAPRECASDKNSQ